MLLTAYTVRFHVITAYIVRFHVIDSIYCDISCYGQLIL